MKTKNLLLVFASVFVLTLLAGFAAADVLDLVIVSVPSSVENDAGSFNVVFSAEYTGGLATIDADLSGSAITTGTGSISFSTGDSTVLTKDVPEEITATVTFADDQTGTIAGTIEVVTESETKEVTFSVPLTIPEVDFKDNFCAWDDGDSSNLGELRVSIRDITVTGFGDEREWLPFDEIEVEVEVENRGEWDVEDIELEWGLYSEVDDEWVIDVDDVESFDLDRSDEETFTFTFTIDDKMDLDLEDLDDGQNYILFVRTTGDIAEDDHEGESTCSADADDIELVIERDYVTLQDFVFQESAMCGTDFTISADAWNVGSRDQDEITVGVSNRDLGLSQVVEVGDINSFESEKFEYTFRIPNDAEEKSYTFTFEVYDEDGDIYENDYDDQESRYSAIISVSGCQDAGSDKDVLVSADLVSGGKAGEELIVSAKITNTGNERATFTINAAGYGQWASSIEPEPSTLSLNSGQSGDVMFTVMVNDDASGDNLFDIEIVSENDLVASQPVSVTIEPKSSGISGIFGGNSLIWIFVLIDIVLIAIIVIVAMRVAKK